MVCGVILCASLVVLASLLSLQDVALDVRVWQSLWDRFDVGTQTNMSREDLARAGVALLAYFRGEAGNPQMTVTIEGTERPLYGEREIRHLEDVRQLYRKGLSLRNVTCVLVPIVFYGSFALGKKAGTSFRRYLGLVILTAGVFLLILALALAAPAVIDFSEFWTGFHNLSFSNELWLLDPGTEWLIKMFPLEFFFAAFIMVWQRMVGGALLMLAAGISTRRGYDRKLTSFCCTLFRRLRRS